jgi:hypothetical protein
LCKEAVTAKTVKEIAKKLQALTFAIYFASSAFFAVKFFLCKDVCKERLYHKNQKPETRDQKHYAVHSAQKLPFVPIKFGSFELWSLVVSAGTALL